MATELPILQCTLDSAGAKEQATRYAHVARHVTHLHRDPHALIAAVDAEVDGNTMQELLDTESACCPFFTITFEDGRLTYATEHAAALDVIEDALTHR